MNRDRLLLLAQATRALEAAERDADPAVSAAAKMARRTRRPRMKEIRAAMRVLEDRRARAERRVEAIGYLDQVIRQLLPPDTTDPDTTTDPGGIE